MSAVGSWITPFMKQCYVTVGVSLNIVAHGLVAGYSAVLLPQLRAPESDIKVDKTTESWIASVFGITFILGNLIVPVIMDKFGRKKSSLFCIANMAVGWYITVWSSTVTSLIVSRIIQGVSLGISVHLSPVMIGEYTSPCNRGAFLGTMTLALSFGILTTHTLGSFLKWQTTAIISAVIVTVNFLIVCFSPETPIWLMNQGRYEESKAVFRWLRGLHEEEELTRMIQITTEQSEKSKNYEPLLRKLKNKFQYLKVTVAKEEFYKPSLIVIHMYMLGQWGGTTILSQFTPDVFFYVVGDGIDTSAMTVALAVHRFVSGIYTMLLIDKFKRRTFVMSVVSVASISLLSIAGYAYARTRNLLPFDHPAIGIILIHLHMASVCGGCLSLGWVLAGELFPLEYKGLGGGLSAISVSLNMFIMAKTGPYLLADVGIHVTYCIYAAVTTYCMIVVLIFLPETQGKTLQDIEDGFRKRRPIQEAGTCEPLTEKASKSASKWKTPLLKQCFATLGVTLSTTGDAHVMGFTSVLLPQLRQSEDMRLDEDRESWIASIVGLSLIVGILIVPAVMSRFGRRTANAMSNGLLAVTWVGLACATNYHTILLMRLLQGLSIGMTSIIAPIIIGEYTSPKYRGVFLTTIALSFSLGVLLLHGLALYFNWQQISFIFAGTCLLDCAIIMLSPETPSFLASKGRYDECRKAFHWLRYPEEDEELNELIKSSMRESKIVKPKPNMIRHLLDKYNNLLAMVKKREFYKPVILMFHLHIINEWSGSNLIDAYSTDMFTIIIGGRVNVPLMMVTADIVKLLSNFIAMIVISKVRRRVMLLSTISLNIASFLLTAGHVYLKTHGISTFDHHIIGTGLLYLHVFTLAVGNLPLPNIICGEIFALEYRGLSSMVTLLFYCINMIINMKIALYLFAKIGLHGAYLIYAGLVTYGLLISWIMLPETKDRTLQDIEEDFRGGKKVKDSEALIPGPDVEMASKLSR